MNAGQGNGLASLFFRNRHLLGLAIVIVLVGGLSAMNSLPRLEDPRIVNRNPIIITPVPGASAERVETLVTEPLEEALEEIAAIKDVESTSSAGVSIVSVELKAAVTNDDNKEIFAEIRDKVGEARAEFPAGTGEPLIDDKRDPVGFTLITAVRWRGASAPALNIMNRIAEDLGDRLRALDGTELVRLYGQPEEEITVTVRPSALADLGLSADEVAARVAAGDVKRPAGTLRGERSDVTIEVTGELDSLERIARIPLAVDDGQGVVRIADVAEVRRGWRQPADAIATVDGDRAVFVAARMDPDVRVDRWAAAANAVVDEFAVGLGDSVVLDQIFEQERYTTDQLTVLVGNLLAGALVVVAVVFVMMGWRLALIVGSSLPMVVALVLFGLQATGNAIHQMSVFGMIIALGLLIDNAIVMADEVTRRKAAGATALAAVEASVRHLFLPLLASTITTVLAFAPILLLPGGAGDFVGSIGGSVIMALVASFAVAMTIIAALAGLFAAPTPAAGRRVWWRDGIGAGRVGAAFRARLAAGLEAPAAAMIAALFLPLAGFIVAASLGRQFFPPVDRDMFEVKVWLPTDSSVENTARATAAIEGAIRDFDEIERVYWLAGGSFPTVYYNLVMNSDSTAYYAHGIVTASSAAEAKAVIAPLQEALDARFPAAQIVVRQFGQGPPVVADIEYRLFGPSIETLQTLGEELRVSLQSHPDVLHVRSTMPRGEPKLWFDAREDEARLAGLSLDDLASQLQGNLEGSTGGTLIENLEQLPVRIRYADGARGDLDDIASMQLVRPGQSGWVALPAVGELRLAPELGGITRFNGRRTNTLKAYTRNGALSIDVTRQVLDAAAAGGFELPAGYRLEIGGTAEQDSEASGDLLAYVPLLITLTIATLILTFRSGLLAALLGVVAGLSVGLGLLATWAIGLPVSFNTILGTLGLIGLAFNNSIVVLAAIRADEAATRGNRSAVLAAVMGTTRHIVSTTLTTIGGFLPLLLFTGGDFWPSLAIVLAGGVGGSMILALVFVPAAYVLLCGRRQGRAAPVAALPAAAAGGG